MISGQKRPQDLNYSEIMSLKSSARDRVVDAVYASNSYNLERAAARVKSAWRGNSASIARPQRFAAMGC
ncbi:MAG: hypothetical protein WC749_00290 [Dehalococcoidia bacterium]|uniref:hypothetical protein n=1 Tax=unclassified Pseudomonas TaxID=196821 RepID=UPI00147316EB|nr:MULTISPECIES: hypothetical protein [unclassified Pseudomonas]NMX92609.1 hypothetical protein [Pseudomonas sp. WS 5086]NMY47112.1 hypothetical protein [Pseudomonas sp. WS 5027]